MTKSKDRKDDRRTRPNPRVVRSDASTLHVDFENVTDTLITARNAGVVIDYQTRARILDNFGYRGRRCAHLAAAGPGEQAQVRLLRAWDAPPLRHGAVLEFVYRAVQGGPVHLRDWPLIQCFTPGGAPGEFELKYLNDPVFGADAVKEAGKHGYPRPVALELRANGGKARGFYGIDVKAHDGLHRSVLSGLPQAAWVRFILRRRGPMVDLFAGLPGAETFVGAYPDLLPGGEIYMLRIGNPDNENARGSGYWDCVRLGRALRRGRRPRPPEPRIRNVSEPAPAPPRVLRLGREKQLLIDDWAIAETRNVRRLLHRPVKHPGNPLISPDKPWEKDGALLFGGVVRDADGGFRMWYNAWDKKPETSKRFHTCYATSGDGVHWVKPGLGLHGYDGARDTNILLKDKGTIFVFPNPDDPRPGFRYLAKMRHQGTQGWTSADGIHWVNHGVIMPQSLDASSCHWDPVRRKYVASVKLGYKGRRYRGYAESDDFLNWTDTYLMMDVDELDVYGDQIYDMQIFRYESLYLGNCMIYHTGSSDTCDRHLAVSHNCRHWERPSRAIAAPKFATKDKEIISYPDPHTQPFMQTGPPGSWDFGVIRCPATPPVRVGDELWFYYTGRQCDHSARLPDGSDHSGPRGQIGLATLRLDGFVSAEADASGGWLLTRPLRLDGSDLYVNANAKGGRLEVEVLDSRLRPIAPYTLDNARAVRSDAVRRKCQWQGAKDLAPLAKRTVRLRFRLSQAALYAFWCE